ncbi:MAG: hypothetical protein H8E32_00095 [Nitrospinae bacterium]|nr:hypothetical protein [Nitrospinota bacterium]
MVNSGFMKKEVARYIFAYYALRCWKSDKFWSDMNRESSYWVLFVYFGEEMEKFEENYEFEVEKYKL